jgi:hypothetical protein
MKGAAARAQSEGTMVLERPPDATTPEQEGTSRLQVSMAAAVGIGRAAEALGRGRVEWLGEAIEHVGGPDGATRHLIDLELRVSDRVPRVTFRKAAYVELGPLRSARNGTLAADISWRAAGLTPLFPVFAGTLRWSDGELRLDGVYAPPGGSIGAVADHLLLNIAARGTGRRLLERVVEYMTS